MSLCVCVWLWAPVLPTVHQLHSMATLYPTNASSASANYWAMKASDRQAQNHCHECVSNVFFVCVLIQASCWLSYAQEKPSNFSFSCQVFHNYRWCYTMTVEPMSKAPDPVWLLRCLLCMLTQCCDRSIRQCVRALYIWTNRDFSKKMCSPSWLNHTELNTTQCGLNTVFSKTKYKKKNFIEKWNYRKMYMTQYVSVMT